MINTGNNTQHQNTLNHKKIPLKTHLNKSNQKGFPRNSKKRRYMCTCS